MLHSLNSSALADTQQGLFSGNVPNRAEAIAHLHALRTFERPFTGVLNYLPKGNLYIRNEAAKAGLYTVLKDFDRQHVHLANAYKALSAFTSQGFYREGLGYLQYCRDAYNFFSTVSGSECESLFAPYMRAYSPLIAPDGKVPTNDTRPFDFRTLLGVRPADELFLHPFYSVFRFPPDTFVMVTHNPSILDWSWDGHVNFDFGHIVVYSRGMWRLAHNWYNGYPAKRAGDGGKSYAQNIILDGLNNREPFWRLWCPLDLQVARPAHNVVQLQYRPGVTRRITVNPASVDIEDVGGAASVFNFDPEGWLSTSTGSTTGGEYRREGDRHFLSGHERSMRVWY